MAAAGALAACSPGRPPKPDAYCVTRAELGSYGTLGGLPLVYEITETPTSFSFDRAFHSLLEDWVTSYRETTSVRPDQLWTYGAWADRFDGCSSWHNAGRAFDLSRLRLPGRDFVSCRYDSWRSAGGAELEANLRGYWALAATLHLHFAPVLTYLYNTSHHNHIHVDNSRSQTELSVFEPGSRVQVQAVQAVCSHLWNEPLEPTGSWDTPTRQALDRIGEQTGLGGDLSAGPEVWHSFLRASARRG